MFGLRSAWVRWRKSQIRGDYWYTSLASHAWGAQTSRSCLLYKFLGRSYLGNIPVSWLFRKRELPAIQRYNEAQCRIQRKLRSLSCFPKLRMIGQESPIQGSEGGSRIGWLSEHTVCLILDITRFVCAHAFCDTQVYGIHVKATYGSNFSVPRPAPTIPAERHQPENGHFMVRTNR